MIGTGDEVSPVGMMSMMMVTVSSTLLTSIGIVTSITMQFSIKSTVANTEMMN